MQDITELQRRLTAALDRIGGGLDRLGPQTGSPPDGETVAAELEAERALTAQLREEIARFQALLSAVEQDRANLKALNDALRHSNQALREAGSDGGPDAGLIDTAMRTELDALRAMRASDRSELGAIIELLKPAVQTNEEAGQDA